MKKIIILVLILLFIPIISYAQKPMGILNNRLMVSFNDTLEAALILNQKGDSSTVRTVNGFVGWVSWRDNFQNKFLGIIPRNAVITEVFLNVVIGFNAGSTDKFFCGHSGDMEAYIYEASMGSVGVRTGVSGEEVQYPTSNSKKVYYRYEGSGTPPTAGLAVFIVFWIQAPSPPQ